MQSEALSLLSELIAIESFSREEKNVADFLERYLEERGYVVSRSGNNIWLMSAGFDSARPTKLLAIIQKNVGCEVTARSTRLSSTATPLTHPVVQRIKACNRTLYGSPTLSDQALMPFSSVKMGPGHSSRSHTADEYILLSEIEHAIALYIEILDGLDTKGV